LLILPRYGVDPGLIPGIESLTNGEISRKRKMLAEMIDGCWRACISPDPITQRPFAANAIISNPPAFAHVHCAEALGIPCCMSFSVLSLILKTKPFEWIVLIWTI